MSERVILSEITPQQKSLLQNAAGRAMQARAVAEREDRTYKELLGMAMPPGANGFDPQAGTFYYEEPPAPPEPEEPTRPELVKDEPEECEPDEDTPEPYDPERELEEDVDLAETLSPETEYEGSEDNARIEGGEIFTEDDES